MSDSNVRGRFLWHELLTTDPASAAAFYSRIVGWRTQSWPQNPSYTLFVTGQNPMAGMMTLSGEARALGRAPHWLCYIGTPNVDETVQRASALGASVVESAHEVPSVGRMAVLRDPQGAAFAAYAPASAPAAAGPPALGDFSWHELATSDWQAALAFYSSLFGWEKTEAMDMGPERGTYQMYGARGTTLGGMHRMPADMPGPPRWLPYAYISDSKRAASLTQKLGGRIVNGPMEVPGGDWVAQGLDPQGVLFAVHSAKPASVAREPAAKPTAAKPKAAKPKARKKAAAKKPAARKATKKRPARKKAARKKVTGARSKTVRRKAARKKAARTTSRAKASRRSASRRPARRPAARTKRARRKRTRR